MKLGVLSIWRFKVAKALVAFPSTVCRALVTSCASVGETVEIRTSMRTLAGDTDTSTCETFTAASSAKARRSSATEKSETSPAAVKLVSTT